MYHLGVVKALFQAGLLPRVISGSSGGSLVAAWICTAKDSELIDRLNSGGIRLGPFEEISVGSVRRKVPSCRGSSHAHAQAHTPVPSSFL
jgi:predicted acylesterase/phospholipase RssA